jgi:hypothetical protein
LVLYGAAAPAATKWNPIMPTLHTATPASTPRPSPLLRFLWLGMAVLNFVAAAPGLLTHDQIVQIYSARFNDFTSHYAGIGNQYHSAMPPFMTLVWRALDAMVPGQVTMFALQITLYWFAVNVLLLRLRFSAIASIAACAALFFWPMWMAQGSVVQNDILGGAIVLLAAALAIDLEHDVPKKTLALCAALVALAGLVRFQFWVAIGPLAWLAYSQKSFATPLREKLLWLAGPFLAVFLLGTVSTHLLLNLPPSVTDPSIRKILEYDIGGMIAESAKPLTAGATDTIAGAGLNVKTLTDKARQLYTPDRVDPMITAEGLALDYFPVPTAKLYSVWIALFETRSGALVAHRFSAFSRVIGFGSVYDCGPTSGVNVSGPDTPLSDKLHLNYPKNAFFVKAITWRYFPAGTVLFKPWPYLVLTLLCFALILRSGMRSSRAIVALLSSGLLYELTFFALPQACDIRYSFAPMAFSLFAVLVVIRGLAERSKALRDFVLVNG